MEIEVLLAQLKVCSTTKNLERGQAIHAKAIRSGQVLCLYVANSLIKMYAKCGNMRDARQVFDNIKQPDVVSWTSLIWGYVDNGESLESLDVFATMKFQGCKPNCFTFVAALKACASLALDANGRAECLQRGKQIHSEIGCYLNIYVQNTLIDMYAKCGSMPDAHKVFDSMKQPSIVSWNALIYGYADNGEGLTALDIFARMKAWGHVPNSITFLSALKACTSLAMDQDSNGRTECRERGEHLHSEIGSHLNIPVQNTLIDMYCKCGSTGKARKVFDSMQHLNVVSWTALIAGYAENGESHIALDMFAKMRSQGCAPNSITFVSVIKACTYLSLEQDASGKAGCLHRGKQIHADVGNNSNIYVKNALIEMYSKCRSMVDAHRVFDSVDHPDLGSWNTLILGYAENGEGGSVLDLFSRMKSEGCTPNCRTIVAALKTCGLLGALESGRKIHEDLYTEKNELNARSNVILVTCLVDFYAKCGSLVEAEEVFYSSDPITRDLRAWTTLLTGYSRLGDNQAVFELFENIQDAGFRPDGVTFLCILTCCVHSGLVQQANEFFGAMTTKYCIIPTIDHYTCMIDISGRSNRMDDAMAFLRNMVYNPDSVAWMTVLGACHKWKNLHIGRLSFEYLVSLEDKSPAAYVLMAHIFRSRDMLKEQAIVLAMRKEVKAWKEPGQSCWTNEMGKVHTFLVGKEVT